jgi:hypothetical protein
MTKAASTSKTSKTRAAKIAPVTSAVIEATAPEAVTGDTNEKTFTMRYVETMTARNVEQFSKDNTLTIAYAIMNAKGINAAMSRPMFAEIAQTLLTSSRIADKKNPLFIGVKVGTKILRALDAIGSTQVSECDPYTRTIAANVISLHGARCGLSMKSALVSLSKSIEYDALDQEQALTRHYNCAPGTANTQASSTRMMMKHLDLCNVAKGKRADVMTVKDNARAHEFFALFSAATVSESK